MRISLADLPASSIPTPDISLNISGGGAISPDEVYSTGTVVCPVGTTFDTNTGLCAGTPTPRVATCPVGVDVTGYGGDAGCVCPPGYSLGLNNMCAKPGGGAGGLLAGMSTTTLAMIAVAGVALLMMAGGRRR